MATNSSNMKNGFAIYLGFSSQSIVHKLVVAIKKKLSANILKGQWSVGGQGCCRGGGGNRISTHDCYNDSLQYEVSLSLVIHI